MNALFDIASSHLALVGKPRLLLLELETPAHENLTELIATLALRGPLYIIAAGEWLPAYSLSRSVRRRTPQVRQVLERLRLMRPFTCYQLEDLLAEARPESDPILVLDFLHHFYDPDTQTSIQQRVFANCCQHLQRLCLSRPLLVFVQKQPLEEYERYFAVLTAIADEIFHVEDGSPASSVQLPLL